MYTIFLLCNVFIQGHRLYRWQRNWNQGLSSGALHNILIPTPSINEQKRIISQIEAIMPIAVKYEKSQEELNQLNDSIHNRLRKSILQEAIQGKLVPQIPEERTAQELLEQIRQEKQKARKRGQAKEVCTV